MIPIPSQRASSEPAMVIWISQGVRPKRANSRSYRTSPEGEIKQTNLLHATKRLQYSKFFVSKTMMLMYMTKTRLFNIFEIRVEKIEILLSCENPVFWILLHKQNSKINVFIGLEIVIF